MTLVGCGEQAAQLDPKWTQPVAVSGSASGLSGWARLHRCQDSIIGARSSAAFLLLSRDRKTWSQLPSMGDSRAYVWAYATADPQSMRVLVAKGYAENEQLVMKVLMGTVTEKTGLRDITEKEWITDKVTLLGETSPNVKLNLPGVRPQDQDVGLGPSILNGSEACIPFCLDAAEVTQRDSAHFVIDEGKGPFADGVFHSSDFGKTWQMEKIANISFSAPDMCKTMGCFYYFANHTPSHSLWFSRKPVGSGKWEESQTITKTLAWVYGRFAVAGEGDTAHVCWMDRRHNKWRFNIDGPSIENNEIFYRRRKDADQDWSKEVLLSKGLLYAYAPTITAEGDKLVVTWAGIQTADKQHTYMGPNDIYYVTSKDDGKTWADPSKVTDGAKDGMTAGMPQVALLNGTIHLLYTQGKSEKSQELSPGLTKLGGEPWPIYYTQRPFPD